jgi:hypothetical protein
MLAAAGPAAAATCSVDRLIPPLLTPSRGEPWVASVKVFVSYSHAQTDWVQDRLVPVLEAGGASVFVAYRHFAAGHTVIGQMDTWQDQAERHVLVLSEQYVASAHCRHEMERAVAADPSGTSGAVLAVRRTDVAVPAMLAPLIHVDLRDDANTGQWQRLLDACRANIGAAVPHWLQVRDDVRRLLRADRSVNLVVPNSKAKWRPLLDDLEQRAGLRFPRIDLDSGEAASRRRLIETMLCRLGLPDAVPVAPDDLTVFTRAMEGRASSRFTWVHFHSAARRPGYDEDFHAALRYLARDARKLVLLVQSYQPT